MAMDESFRKPGAIPFKWEIRPGVPKDQQQQLQTSFDRQRTRVQRHQPHHQPNQQSGNHNHPFQTAPEKLKPPPAGFNFQPPLEVRTARSFRSAPRSRSERYRFDGSSTISGPKGVAVSSSCLPSPLLWQKYGKKIIQKTKPAPETEPDYTSDLETLSRWSRSSKKSFSPFPYSPSSSSFSSQQSSPSPRPVGDAEWAGFGLF